MIRLAAEDKLIRRLFGRRLPQVSTILIPGFIWQDWHVILSYLVCVPRAVFLPAACSVSLLIPRPTGLPASVLGTQETVDLVYVSKWDCGDTRRPCSTAELSSEFFPRLCFFTSWLILCVFRCCNCQSRRYELAHCFNLHFLDY